MMKGTVSLQHFTAFPQRDVSGDQSNKFSWRHVTKLQRMVMDLSFVEKKGNVNNSVVNLSSTVICPVKAPVN